MGEKTDQIFGVKTALTVSPLETLRWQQNFGFWKNIRNLAQLAGKALVDSFCCGNDQRAALAKSRVFSGASGRGCNRPLPHFGLFSLHSEPFAAYLDKVFLGRRVGRGGGRSCGLRLFGAGFVKEVLPKHRVAADQVKNPKPYVWNGDSPDGSALFRTTAI